MANNDDEPTELPPLYIRERMKAAGKTGVEVAGLMNTTPATVSRLLNGRRRMTLEWLFAFSKALEVPIAALFSEPGTVITDQVSRRSQLDELMAFAADMPGTALDHLIGLIESSAKSAEPQPKQTPESEAKPLTKATSG